MLLILFLLHVPRNTLLLSRAALSDLGAQEHQTQFCLLKISLFHLCARSDRHSIARSEELLKL